MTFSLKIQTAKIFFALTYLFVLGCSDPAGESNNITSADINNQHLDMKDMGKKNTHDAPIHKPDLLQDTQTMDIKKDAHNDVSNDAEMKASLMPRLNITPQVLDEVMAIPVPTKAKEYSLGGGNFYGRNAPTFLFLSLITYEDPNSKTGAGIRVKDRVLEHFRAAISPISHPLLAGGHGAWFDQQVPLAIAVARRTPEVWSMLTVDEKSKTDTLMHHALHVANIFCNSNSARPGKYASVSVDMNMAESGSLPNQSSAHHAYGIASYIYFGGISETTKLLAAYDLTSFRSQLINSGFDDIEKMYANKGLQDLLNGKKEDRAWPDPKGVKKPLLELNTLSLERSPPGKRTSL